jgi:hypothetical protein
MRQLPRRARVIPRMSARTTVAEDRHRQFGIAWTATAHIAGMWCHCVLVDICDGSHVALTVNAGLTRGHTSPRSEVEMAYRMKRLTRTLCES